MPNLDDIKTVFILMMENRSFDHMLGYLSLPPFSRTDVNGQSTDPAWLKQFANFDRGQSFQPRLNTDPYQLPKNFDPPHQRDDVANHLGPLNNGVYPMNGFVSAIPNKVSTDPETRRLVMDYFGPDQVPISHFFAQNFTICDRWFCPLPSGTQSNRLMAMSGNSALDSNSLLLPNQDLVYDWLTARNISWRVYHQGIPFFTMMPRRIPAILWGKNFRAFTDFQSDMTSTDLTALPQVIFIEPTYGDSPRLGRSTDDHAPSGASNGQEFMMQTYMAIKARRSLWNQSLLFIIYDEHGGFFDHVSPPLIPTKPPAGVNYNEFKSLGVRTPTFIISPYVKKGACVNRLFDHTSILKFLGEKFNQEQGGGYSDDVDARKVESASAALSFDAPIIPAPAAPPVDAYLNVRPAEPEVTVPPQNSDLQKGFQQSIEEMKKQGADATHPKFGPLISALSIQIPAPPTP